MPGEQRVPQTVPGQYVVAAVRPGPVPTPPTWRPAAAVPRRWPAPHGARRGGPRWLRGGRGPSDARFSSSVSRSVGHSPIHPDDHLALHHAHAAELRKRPMRAVSPQRPGTRSISASVSAGPSWTSACGWLLPQRGSRHFLVPFRDRRGDRRLCHRRSRLRRHRMRRHCAMAGIEPVARLVSWMRPSTPTARGKAPAPAGRRAPYGSQERSPAAALPVPPRGARSAPVPCP